MNEKNGFLNKRRKDLVFCILMILIPAIQFCIFYIGVNFNSVLMAFQSYKINPETGLGAYVFNHFANFKTIWLNLKYEGSLLGIIGNSFVMFFCNMLIGTTLALFFSLYIYKKMPAYGVFKVLLFMPSVLSSIVTVTMFRYFAENAIPAIFGMENGLLSTPGLAFPTLIFFNIWISFGTSILMYSGAMNGIDESVIEAAKLDGVTPLREFFSVIFPLIYPTVVTFVIVGVAGIFTNQMNLFSFYGNDAIKQYQTMGYYLFRGVNLATLAEYPELATYAVVLTAIAVPMTLLSKKALEKFGPSVE